MIQLLAQRVDASIEILLLNNRTIGLFFSKRETCAVIMSVHRSRPAEKACILRRRQAGRHGLPRRRKFKPIIRFAGAIEIKRRAPVGGFDEMTRNQFCIDIGKERRDIGKKLARDIFSCRRRVAKRRIVVGQKLVVELIVDHLAGAFFDFADVNQHSRDRIDSPAENKIGGIITTGAVARAGFGTKCGEVFVVGPARNKQPARS